jgi:hypothetical protein
MLRIPLQGDGRPCPPFDGGDIITNPSGQYVAVTERQAIAVRKASTAVARPESDPSFKAAVVYKEFPIRWYTKGVTAVAYRLSASGNFSWVSLPDPDCTTQPSQIAHKQVDLSGVNVAVIPSSVSTSPEEIRSRKTVAAIATPVTVVGDVAIAIAAAPAVVCFTVCIVVSGVFIPYKE